ncbi:MAG: S1 family peptidase [Actinobacteria bacterium]|nr:S1 family peptidase [Actinomycetota bacterium]
MRPYRRWVPAAVVCVVVLALSGAPAFGSHAIQQATIEPGAAIVTDAGYCTLSWIFDGTKKLAGEVYASTAAHCVDEVGQAVSLATTSLGAAQDPIGKVAFRGDPEQPGRDYAFIKIASDDRDRVDPAMKGHPRIPTGVSRDYREGDLMQFSGHGVGFNLTSLTRQERVGVLNWTDRREHQIVGGVAPGDSGGPVANLSDGGTAFGIVATVGVGIDTRALTLVTAGEGGANLDWVLADAAAHDFTVSLRTVDG